MTATGTNSGVIATMSGSTDKPVQDGLTRGVTVTALLGAIRFVTSLFGIEFTPEQLGDLMLFLPGLVLIIGGLWDRFVKPKVS